MLNERMKVTSKINDKVRNLLGMIWLPQKIILYL